MLQVKKNTSVVVRVGPFVDATDAVTPETGVTLGAADEAELLKHDGEATIDISGRTWTAITGADGWYDLTLTAIDTDTLGNLTVIVQDANVSRPVRVEFQVVADWPMPSSLYRRNQAGPIAVSRSYNQQGFLAVPPSAGTEDNDRIYLASGHTHRIRRNGTVTGVRVYLGQQANQPTWMKFKVWRLVSGTTYNEVGSSEQITVNGPNPFTPNAWNTITFTQPIRGVLVGDVTSFTGSNQEIGAAANVFGRNAVPSIGTGDDPTDNTIIYYFIDGDRSGDGVDFSSGTGGAETPVEWGVSWEAQMADAPTCIAFGSDFFDSFDHTPSFLHSCEENVWTDAVLGQSIMDRLYDLDPVLFDGMMHGQNGSSTSSTDASTRDGGGWLATRTNSPSDPGVSTTWLDTEVIGYSPRFAIMSLGINDAVTGDQTVPIKNATANGQTFYKNINTIAHKLLAADITPVFLGVFHVNAQVERREQFLTYNSVIKRYCAERPQIVFIDVQAALDGYIDIGSGVVGRAGRDTVEFGAPPTAVHGNTTLANAVAQLIYGELASRRRW